MDFFNTLSELMREYSMNTLDLQRETGIKESTYRNWKKGSQPTAEKLVILAQFFNTSTDELLGLKPRRELTENDEELLELFHQLPEREQIKLIGRIEELINNYKGETKLWMNS